MYDELVALLRKKYDKAPMVMEAADVIEEISRLAEVQAKRAMKWAADAEKAEKAQRWIPVTERLPDDFGDDVLVTDGEDYAVGFWREDAKAWDSTDFGWLENRSEPPCGIHTVTHWMPLPPLPELPEEEAPAGPYDLLYEEGGPDA